MNFVNIIVNDQSRQLSPGTTVAELIRELGMRSQFVAVERNRELVPRAEHARCILADMDQLEIVTLVGGG